jgi:hypothetical protein
LEAPHYERKDRGKSVNGSRTKVTIEVPIREEVFKMGAVRGVAQTVI